VFGPGQLKVAPAVNVAVKLSFAYTKRCITPATGAVGTGLTVIATCPRALATTILKVTE